MATEKRTLDDIKRENEALERELASLRLALGIEAHRDADEEKDRITDASRQIERKKKVSVPLSSVISEAKDGVHVRLQVGDFSDVGLAIRLNVGADAAAATTLSTLMEVPEGKTTFAFLDIGIAPGSDEGKLGELVGIMDGLLSAAGAALNEKAGFPLYNSHSVRPMVDKDGANVLRVSFFCEINPAEMAAAQLGKDASLFSPAGLIDIRVAVETPLNLNLLKDDNARLTLDTIRARVAIDGTLDKNIDRRIHDLIIGIPGPRRRPIDAGMATFVGAAIKLLSGLNLDVQTVSLEELKGKFSTPYNAENIRHAHEALRHYGDQLATIPIRAAVNGMLSGVAAQFGSSLPGEAVSIYNAVKSNLLGPRRLHIQMNDAHIELAFIGFDIFQFAPPLGDA